MVRFYELKSGHSAYPGTCRSEPLRPEPHHSGAFSSEAREPVPLFGLRYVEKTVPDYRDEQVLAGALKDAGLRVTGVDIRYVYVAGYSPEIEDGLARVGLDGLVALSIMGCVWSGRRPRERRI